MRPNPTRTTFELRPHGRDGVWESNDGRYRTYAHQILAELEQLCIEVQSKWPCEANTPITDERQHSELWSLARRRDRSSDTTRIYAAMAVEGFLNFYGVYRLGQEVFDEHFERAGVVQKLRKLLLFCDNLNIPENDPLCASADRVAKSRNALVHPKTREVGGDPATHQRSSTKLPDVARESVDAMEAFFSGFATTVPDVASHLIRR